MKQSNGLKWACVGRILRNFWVGLMEVQGEGKKKKTTSRGWWYSGGGETKEV